jgi:MFS transporter, DHA1 family, inner membrane transport protein
MGRILVLTLGTFALGTELFVIAGILPLLARDLGVGLPAAGQLVTVFALVYAAGAPVLASATGGIGRRRLLAGALTAFGVANGLAAFAPNFGWMLASRVFSALTACLFLPSALALAAHLAPSEKRARALATVTLGFNLSTVLGVPVGIWIASAWGWRWIFGAIAILSLAVAAGVRAILPELVPPPGATFSQRMAVLRLPGVFRGLSLTSVVLLSVFSVYTYLAPILHASAGLGGADLARLLFFFGVMGAAGAWLGGFLADRFGSKPVLVGSICVLTVVLIGFSASAHSFASAAVLLSVWGVFGGAFNPVQLHRLLGLVPQNPTSVLAWNSSAIYLGQAMAGAFGGAVLELRGPSSLGWAGAILMAASLVLLASPRPATASALEPTVPSPAG